MQVASCRVKVSEYSDVPFNGLTPPEAVLLENMHRKNANGQVISGVQVIGEGPSAGEFERLKLKYGDELVRKYFPGIAPRLPESFAEIGVEAIASSFTPEMKDAVLNEMAKSATSPRKTRLPKLPEPSTE